MSLLNNVLRDLAARDAAVALPHAAKWVAPPEASHTIHYRGWCIGVLVLCGAMGCLLIRQVHGLQSWLWEPWESHGSELTESIVHARPLRLVDAIERQPEPEGVPEMTALPPLPSLPAAPLPQAQEPVVQPAPQRHEAPVPQPPAQHVQHVKKPSLHRAVLWQYQEAQRQLAAGAWEQALPLLQRVLEDWPLLQEAREDLIRTLLAHDQHQEAWSVAAAGVRAAPDEAQYGNWRMWQARVRLAEGQHAKALEVLRDWVPDVEQFPEYHALTAAVYEKLGQHAAALRTYRRLVLYHPDRGVWWMGKAIAEDALGDSQHALVDYRRAQGLGLNDISAGFVSQRMAVLTGAIDAKHT